VREADRLAFGLRVAAAFRVENDGRLVERLDALRRRFYTMDPMA
jgi:hypothetical protein